MILQLLHMPHDADQQQEVVPDAALTPDLRPDDEPQQDTVLHTVVAEFNDSMPSPAEAMDVVRNVFYAILPGGFLGGCYLKNIFKVN